MARLSRANPMFHKAKLSRGSIVFVTFILIVAVSAAAYAVLDLALGSYRLSQRNEYLARGQALAESEMEYVYFRIKNEMISNATTADQLPARLGDICDLAPDPNQPTQQTGETARPTTPRVPFIVAMQNTPEKWVVKRSFTYDFQGPGGIPNSTNKANFNWFTVKVEVISKSASAVIGDIDVHLGRHVNSSVSPIFQSNIFSQGDLEFSPGGSTTINGDISANGRVYIGSAKGNNGTYNMTVNAAVRYLTPVDASTTINLTSLADGTPINPPVFQNEAAQIQAMTQPANLMGGLSASDTALQYGADYTSTDPSAFSNLFGKIDADPNMDRTTYDREVDIASNNVYRSVIAPSPQAVLNATTNDEYKAEYPDVASRDVLNSVGDDASIGAQRAYNHAGLVVTVNSDDPTKFTITEGPGGVTAPTAFYGAVSSKTTYDLREGKSVAVTEIDVGKLNAAIKGNYTDFNGLLYVYLADSSPDHPAAVRLVNGAETPGTYNSDGSSALSGFSVATNGGLYVQGDYNTATGDHAPIDLQGTGSNVNPAMLMADAVTVLSSDWKDSNVYNSDGTPKTDPMDSLGDRQVSAGTTMIAAGILTGSVAKDYTGAYTGTADGYIKTGGGQNLVRFMEDWNTNNSTVNFFGAIGRLFQSTQFTAPYKATTTGVYIAPGARTFSFNSSMATKPPPRSPTDTQYSRGNIFKW